MCPKQQLSYDAVAAIQDNLQIRMTPYNKQPQNHSVMKTQIICSLKMFLRRQAGFVPCWSAMLAVALMALSVQQASADVKTLQISADNASFTTSSSWGGGTPTTNSILYIGTATTYGGTNLVTPGHASIRSAQKLYAMQFNNNFNPSNAFTLGSYSASQTYTMTVGWNSAANPNPPYIQTLMTNGTVRIQPLNTNGGTTFAPLTFYLEMVANTNLVFDTAANTTVDMAVQILATNTANPFVNGLTKISPGTLTLENTNTFGGGVWLQAGTLNIGNSQALGLPTGTFTISGGTIDNSSGATMTLSNYPNVWNGNFSFLGTSDLNLGTGSVTLGASSQVTVTAGNLTVGGAVGPSSGGYGLTKAGSGNLNLNAVNTYNGNTTISAGTLALGASASIANSPVITVNGVLDVSAIGSFALTGSQVLAGSGGVKGTVGTASGTAIYAGTDGTTGTLTFSNSLSLASGATCNFDLGTTAGGANDKIAVQGTGTALTLNNNVMIIKAPSVLDTSVDYLLVSVPNGSISGSFNAVPTWSGTPPANFGNYSVVTTSSTVKLHYTPPVNNSLDHFVVSTSGSPTTAGTTFTLTIQAQNASNSNITNNSVDGTLVTLSSTGSVQFDADANGVFGDNYAALTNGVCTLNAKDNKAETVNFVALSGAATGTNFNFVINPGTVSKLQILLPGETAVAGSTSGKTGTANTETSGTSFNAVVNAVDAFWNPVSSSDTVQLSCSGDATAILPSPTALTGGSVTLSVTDRTVGSGITLTATDNSNGSITASTSAAYSVVAGAISKLVLVAPGETLAPGSSPGKTGTTTSQTQGIGYPVTVQAMDANWNLVSTNDTVAITSSVGGDGLPANAALSGGSRSFNVTNNTPGSVTITASDITHGSVTSSSSTLQISVVPMYQSKQSGDWSSPSTWNTSTNGGVTWTPASGTPSALGADTITITNGNTVTLSTSLAADQLTIQAGGQLVVSNVTLTINDGSGTDLDVFGTLQVTGASGAISSTTAQIIFENGSIYNHNRNLGGIPIATWATNSTCDLTGTTTGGAYGSSQGLQNFGNFVFNSPLMTGDLNFAGTFPPLIAGEFDILNTGGQELRFNTTKATTNSIVDGNFVMSGNSYLVVSQGSADNMLTVMGDMLFQGGIIRLATTTGKGILNLYGNLAISSGAQFTTTLGDSTNTSLINFNKTGTQTYSNAGSFTGNGSSFLWTVSSNTTLDIGTNYLAGSAFILSSGGSLTGHGVIAAPISGAGTVSPGPGAAVLTAQNGLNLSAGGTYFWQLTSNTTSGPGTNFDVIAVNSGNLVLGGTSTLSINFSGGSSGPDLSNPFWQTAHSWTIVTLSGGAANSTAFTTLLNAHYGSASFSNYADSSGNIVLAYNPGLTTFQPLYDSGGGLFGGENLILTNLGGQTFYVWSAPASSAGQSVTNWTLERSMGEQPLNNGTGNSRYAINVAPSSSPTYYIAGTARSAPYDTNVGVQSVAWVTTDESLDYTVFSTNTTITPGGIFLLFPSPAVVNTGTAAYSAGVFTFQFSASAGQAYSILASTDLATWTNIYSGTAVSSPVTVTDTNASHFPKRFYKVSEP